MIRVGQHLGKTGIIGWIGAVVNVDGAVNSMDMIISGQYLIDRKIK